MGLAEATYDVIVLTTQPTAAAIASEQHATANVSDESVTGENCGTTCSTCL